MTQVVDTTPATTAQTENDGNSTPAINTTCMPTTLTHDTEVINPHQIDDNYSPLLQMLSSKSFILVNLFS